MYSSEESRFSTFYVHFRHALYHPVEGLMLNLQTTIATTIPQKRHLLFSFLALTSFGRSSIIKSFQSHATSSTFQNWMLNLPAAALIIWSRLKLETYSRTPRSCSCPCATHTEKQPAVEKVATADSLKLSTHS